MSRRNIPLPTNEITARYEAGENTYELAEAYGVCHHTIRHRLHAAGVTIRPCSAPPGNTNARRPGGPLCFVGAGYLGTYDREGERRYVHRGCWEAHHGSIPSGHIVHHIDGDRLDNRIENLACMPHGEHTRLHRGER